MSSLLRLATLALTLTAALLLPTAASAITLVSPANGAHVTSRVAFQWALSPGAFYGGVHINTPAVAIGGGSCCTLTEQTFTPPVPLGSGLHTWSGQEEVPSGDSSTTVYGESQSFIVDPSIRISALAISWAGNFAFASTSGKVTGARMTLVRSFTESNLHKSWEVTTVRNAAGKLVYQVRGFGATSGQAGFLSPVRRVGVFALPTIPAGRYRVTMQIREDSATGPVRATKAGVLVVRSRARGFGRKVATATGCGIDIAGCAR